MRLAITIFMPLSQQLHGGGAALDLGLRMRFELIHLWRKWAYPGSKVVAAKLHGHLKLDGMFSIR